MSFFRQTATIICSLTVFVPVTAVAQAQTFERDFVITAYYSPLPGQCCYIMGSESADRDMNGQGTHGADGTPVYPGMIAAPKSYAFGTRIELPGIGIVTVHDRGGAIVEQEKTDRLDVWMGSGEEGLARAIAFGVQRVRGTVYPPGTKQPAEIIALQNFPAPFERIAPYAIADVMSINAKAGDKSWSVRTLQSALAAAGVFNHPVTGLFGAVTQDALSQFMKLYGISSPSDRVTPEVGAYLLAVQDSAERDIPLAQIDRNSSEKDIKAAQRLLRGFGLYDGRTDGKYSETLHGAIVHFQKEKGLVASSSDIGAGRIGPKTRSALAEIWRKRLVTKLASRYLLRHRVEEALVAKNALLKRTLEKGQKGSDVTLLQRQLAEKGFFVASDINGYFGDKTEAAVSAFQKDRGLVTFWSTKGEGVVGPLTLQKLQQETVASAMKRVQGNGWQAL